MFFFRQLLTLSFLAFSLIHHFPSRLVVTENAQCGLWQKWCSEFKKARNSKISHHENPARSDAVKFFLHTIDQEPYSFFNFKHSLYNHFQALLSSPDKALLLTDANFATKVNPARKYPACEIDTANLFDEDGDPVFILEPQSSPNPATPTIRSTKSSTNKQNTGLKRTLCTSVQKKKKSKKQRAAVETEQPARALPGTATEIPPLPAAPPVNQPPQHAPPKPKPYRHPQLLALPSKIAVPIDPTDQQLLACSFLPCSGLRGNALFNAFVNFCGNNEQHSVLVSRAFVSQNITLQGEMVAVRQVKFLPRLNSPDRTIHRTHAFPFSLHFAAQLSVFRKTAIPAQFRVEWLRSKYRTAEWGPNVEFLRLEGFTHGE